MKDTRSAGALPALQLLSIDRIDKLYNMAESDQTTPLPRRPRGAIGIAILLIIIVSVIGLLVYQTISPGQAALVIESNPQAIVYINGEQKGKTPLEVEAKAEEVVVKLVPESFTVPLTPYETKVELTEGVKTIVRRNFGEGNGGASGQIISFEKTASSETSVAVISIPDGVEVSVDGKTEGVSPLKISSTPGSHTLALSSGNYEAISFDIKAVSGYTVTAIVELSRLLQVDTSLEGDKSEDVLASEDDLDVDVEIIEIQETSVGFLRVRLEASVDSDQVGQVAPGERFEVLEHDEEEDWYKINFKDDEEGWVSGEFVQIVEE